MFIQDLEMVDRIRVDAVNSLEAHTSGIKKLTAYAAQLVWMGGKFPIDVIDTIFMNFLVDNPGPTATCC